MKKMKTLSLFLTFVLLLGILPFNILKANAATYTVSTQIDGINISRNTNYTVVYNRLGRTTNTNVYGYEVVVTEGVVTAIGGNNSLIPNVTGSFVVSGHGTAIEWLKKNVVIGMKASYTSSLVTFIYDNSTVLANLNLEIATMQAAFDNAKSTFRIIDYNDLSTRIAVVNEEFAILKTAYEANNAYDLETNSAPLLAEVFAINGLCAESSKVEIRGVWIRPTQTTTAAVESYVQQLYDAGINMISIETLYNSTMIMPMPADSLFEQNPNWKGFDMLQAFITACHARNMELHVWMPVYYVGHGNTNARCVGVKKPDWVSLTNTGSYYSPNDADKFMFLSPANPEVKAFLLSNYRYILTKYDIDGFQLDYIRYAGSGTVDFGYDAVTKAAFKAKYGFTPQYDKDASYWDTWVAFRAGCVTDMVKSVKALIKEVKPSVLLTADVFVDYKEGYNYIYQDSTTWLEEGYLDMIHPMAYGDGYVSLVGDFLAAAGDCHVGVGLGSFMDELSTKDLARQAIAMSNIKAAGSVFFEASSFLEKGVGTVLNQSLYRNRALSPTYDEKQSVLLLTTQARTRIDEAILPFNGMTSAEAIAVKTKLAIITASATTSLSNQVITDIDNAITAVNSLSNGAAKSALLDDLNYTKKITLNALKKTPSVSTYFTLEENDRIVGFLPSTVQSMTVATVKTLLEGTVTVKDKSGAVLADDKKIGTGCVISNGELRYTVILKGDLNGDGAVGSVDYLMTKRIFLGTYLPDTLQKRAAALTDGLTPKAADYLKIKRHFLGTYNLYT